MGQQFNKVEKRKRHKAYLLRKKAKIKELIKKKQIYLLDYESVVNNADINLRFCLTIESFILFYMPNKVTSRPRKQ